MWLGLPSAWNELQSSEVGVTEPGLKKVSRPSPKSGVSADSPGLSSGRVGALVFARRGLPVKSYSFFTKNIETMVELNKSS